MNNVITAPFNEITRNEYKGGNIEILLAAMHENEFDETKGWGGFHQWLGAGRAVMKGQRGTRITKFVKVEKTSKNGAVKETLIPRHFTVFHFDQTQVVETKEVK